MLYRLLFCLFLSCSVTFSMAEQSSVEEEGKLAKTVVELERSVAVLQLSTASLGDYQTLATKMAHVNALEYRVNFLGNLTFLLFMSLVVFFFKLRHQQKRLLALEQRETEKSSQQESKDVK
ncbi:MULTISPECIES: hypothetical protein [Marinomonas]|uniref:CcmD family protein n=1 Tax=Marinomonas arctica TaxID=383750 RepID=A0A7H1J5B4_9GAMM|nr:MULTISPECIES: hypothetical protein [Marinomonas]MCS7486383.1 hypothetical protein [Marinomonas sp. BSi20414]QNT05680.1 hypothetical protein IBG28_18825 [Marinomonas arctica]GGN29503.1 hypothetical protein GCM10011350_21750 [Marinomonas arctica]